VAAEGDQLGGPGNLRAQLIDVDVAAFQLAQDRVEFRQRVGVTLLRGVGGHAGSTVLAIVPSASCVRSRVPGPTSDGERTTLPASSRVMLHPRRSACTGSSRRTRAS